MARADSPIFSKTGAKLIYESNKYYVKYIVLNKINTNNRLDDRLFTLRLRPVRNCPASSLTKFSRALCLSVTLLAASISCSYINSLLVLELLPWLSALFTKLTPLNSSKLSLSKNSFAFRYKLFCTQEMLSLCRQSSKLCPAARTTADIKTTTAIIFMILLRRNGKSKTRKRNITVGVTATGIIFLFRSPSRR